MGTLNEDLNRVAITLRSVTKHDVEVADGSVYVNFDFRTALVIDPELTPHGLRWNAMAMAWDASGGVSDEHEVFTSVIESLVPRGAKMFLDEQDARAAYLEGLMEGAETE